MNLRQRLNKAIVKKLFVFLVLFAGFLISFPFIWRAIVQRYYEQKIYDAESVPATQVAIVLGAGIDGNGT